MLQSHYNFKCQYSVLIDNVHRLLVFFVCLFSFVSVYSKLMAFIWDSSRLEYEAAKDCELVTAGELFGRSGYGIGLQKASPWTDVVTLAILDFHESKFVQAMCSFAYGS